MIRSFVRLIADEGGQDLIEYALLGGLIGTAGLLLVPEIVSGMSNMYANTISAVSGPSGIVEPCPPAPFSCS